MSAQVYGWTVVVPQWCCFANGRSRQIRGQSSSRPVHIEEIVADRQSYSVQPDLRLPSLTRDVEINYTALTSSLPRRCASATGSTVTIGIGRRPEGDGRLYYNNLPPGNYRFTVMPANNERRMERKGSVR